MKIKFKHHNKNVSHETFLFRSYPQAKNSIKIHGFFYAPLIPYFKRNYFSIFLVLFFSKEINKLSTTCIHVPLDSHNLKKSNIPRVSALKYNFNQRLPVATVQCKTVLLALCPDHSLLRAPIFLINL